MKKLLSVLLCSLLLLAGCARIPTSGAPQAVERPSQQTGGLVLDSQGPAENADPQEIVVGFMRAASAGFSDDFVVARQFLTESAAISWNPATQVRIYPDTQNQQISQTRSGGFRVTVPAGGNVDSVGLYTAATADATISSEFSLVRNKDGQWRIAVLPDGVTMPESLFQTLFVRTPLYFPTQDQQAFTTEMRWYARSQVVSAAARGLVEGPSPWLAGSVAPLLPPNTRLVNPVVTDDTSRVRVDLNNDVAELSERSRNILFAQFTKTLTGIPGVSAVEVSANGVPLQATEHLELPSYPFTSPGLVALVNNQPAVVKDDGVHIISVANNAQSLGLTALAVPYEKDVSTVLGLGKDGSALYRITRDGSVDLVAAGNALIPPSTDRRGFVWTGEMNSDQKLLVANIEAGTVSTLDVPWLANMKIRKLAVSREGSRLAIVAEHDGTEQLLLAGIVRTDIGLPQSVSEPIRIGQQLTDITDIAWVGDDRLVAIAQGSQSGSTNALYSLPLGENSSVLATREDMVSITAGRSTDSILLNTTDGDIYAFEAGGWRLVLQNAVAPAYPG